MSAPRRFLIVDDNSDSRTLLVRTLLRKFPTAVVLECQDAGTATTLASSEKLDAIVAHRAGEVDGETLIRLVRHAAPATPLVMMSGIDRTAQALAAGATCFLHYDQWLRLGTVISQLILPDGAAQSDTAAPFATAAESTLGRAESSSKLPPGGDVAGSN